jgi:magnesium transporter
MQIMIQEIQSSMPTEPQKPPEENVLKERIDHLIEHRMPWLLIGLLGGIATTFIVSKFEQILAADVRLAFFIPIIVYMSDAVGTQTETIYVRALANGKTTHFRRYLLKETLVGLGLGTVSGFLVGAFASYWLESTAIGLTLGLTMLLNLTMAPILAVFIPRMLYKQHADPALGSGPLATIAQDLVSLLTYFFVANWLLF